MPCRGQGGTRQVGGVSQQQDVAHSTQGNNRLCCYAPYVPAGQQCGWHSSLTASNTVTQQVARTQQYSTSGYLSMQIFEPPRDLDGGGNQLVHLEAAPQVGALVREPALVDGILGGKKCGFNMSDTPPPALESNRDGGSGAVSLARHRM